MDVKAKLGTAGKASKSFSRVPSKKEGRPAKPAASLDCRVAFQHVVVFSLLSFIFLGVMSFSFATYCTCNQGGDGQELRHISRKRSALQSIMIDPPPLSENYLEARAQAHTRIQTETETTAMDKPTAVSNQCAVDWSNLPQAPQQACSAVFSPYNIVFGGGERYILTAAMAMQDLGYSVDMLVKDDNVCQTKEELLRIAHGMRVPLIPEKLNLKIINQVGTRLEGDLCAYSLFLHMGNDKVPYVRGHGHVNFFMNQFPFDLTREQPDENLEALTTYDYVLLNSKFTFKYWHIYMDSVYDATFQKYGLMPSVEILYPPVEPFAPNPVASNKKHIVLLGRFFAGRQSKGHLVAISVFRDILPSLPFGTELHLVGNLMPGHSDYMAEVEKAAKGLPVKLHVSSPTSEVEATLQSAVVQWHMTGVDVKAGEDPASDEHFGISVAEGMSAGCIPVVLNRGGLPDIVDHGKNGYLADDPEGIKLYTVKVFQMSQEEMVAFRSRAIENINRFNYTSFFKKFQQLSIRGERTKPHRYLIQTTKEIVNAREFDLPQQSKYAAMIIEPRYHYAFEYTVKNVMYHLNGGDLKWSLFILHGPDNIDFVHRSLRSMKNVQYRQLVNETNIDIPLLNHLMKETGFWNMFQSEHIFIFQTDALLVHGNVNKFLQYDYIGAPWHPDNERWGLEKKEMPHGVGNGGLSLRTIKSMVDLSERYGANSTDTEQEDFFFAKLIETDMMAAQQGKPAKNYILPDRDTAYQFVVEVPCVDLEKNLKPGSALKTVPYVPLGLHATWYYFIIDPARVYDLLRMLELSLCGLR